MILCNNNFNRYLREEKVNNLMRLVSNSFPNAVLLDTDVWFTTRKLSINNVCRLILKEIIKVGYVNDNYNYSTTPQVKNCPILIDKCVQTVEAHELSGDLCLPVKVSGDKFFREHVDD